MPSPAIQYQSSSRRLAESGIYKRPISKAEFLQLWVEHGARISSRSAILLSRSVSAHTAAVSAQTESTISHALSSHTPPKSFRSAAPATIMLATRRNLRTRRQQGIRLLKEQEQAEERRLLQAEKERVAGIREQQAREAQQRERERQAAAERALQLEAAEKRVAERQAREKQLAVEKAAADAEELAKKQVQAVSGGVIEQVSGNRAFDVGRGKKPEADPKKAEVSSGQQMPSQIDPSNLQKAIVSGGHSAEVAKNGNFAEGYHIPEDVARIIDVWNRLCDEAEPFRRDVSMKKPRLEIKKQINLSVNQIAASVKQVVTKVKNLVAVLRNAKRGGGPAGESFAIKELAQRLVSESDGSVALNRTAAFAVGAVIVGVTASVQNRSRMRDVFLGAFYKHCMYTIPAYPRKHKGESANDYRLRIGYKDEETAESYMERSCGCISLFAAVVQTDKVLGPAQRSQNASNPFSLDIGWTWLARIANREQRAITPAITYAFLEIAGHSMSARYRRQFTKLIAMVQKSVVLKAVKSAPPGPTSRMDSLLEEFISAGCAFPKPPEGRELPAKDMEFL